MKDAKRIAVLSLTLLGAALSLQAIPMERNIGEIANQQRAALAQRESSKSQEGSESSSSLVVKGTLGEGIAENSTATDENEEFSCSDEELDAVLEKATQARERWKAIHVDATTSPTAVQELVDQLERDEDLWESKQEQLNFLAEQMEAPAKLQLVIRACGETLNILRGQEPQLIPKKRRSYRSDSLSTDEGQLYQDLMMGVASLSLKSSIESCFHDQPRFAELERYAKAQREYAQQRGERAQQKHREARNSFVQRLLTEAEDCYQEAILLAQQTARAWEKSERAHLELMEISGQKLRRWGQLLKTTWQERAEAWEKERSSMFEFLQREQKIREIQQRISETTAEKKKVLDLQLSADQEKGSEIGATYDSIARKLEVVNNHLKKILEAYQKGDHGEVNTIEGKIKILNERIQNEKEHLNRLNTAMKIWKKDYQTEASRYLEIREESLPDGKKKVSSIYKKHFIGPLLRIEKFFDQDERLVEEIKMAAEHLALQLTCGEDTRLFIQKLKENFPEVNFKIEDVFPQTALYRLCFSPSDLDSTPQKLLNLFDQVKNFIQKNHLADCYPDLFSTLSSSKEGEDPLKKKVIEQEEVAEPWAFHSRFGINPPADLFDEDHPAVGIPTTPILLTIVDSGILSTHQAFRDQMGNTILHEEEDDVGESLYGYNSCAVSQDQKGLPKDLNGHGTHIAGIIAGLPHRVIQVEVKKKKRLLAIMNIIFIL